MFHATHPTQHFHRRLGPFQIIAYLVVIVGALWLGIANAAEPSKGKVIAKKDLPAAIATPAKAKGSTKFPGVPACSKGRMLTDISTVMDLDDSRPDWWKNHKCYGKPEVYICTAFGKLSVRCE